ncbi:MAG: DUF4012 domain-containing protein [Patescibacteria group bacterium]
MGTKYILPALFDVRPVNQTGDLDMERIKQVKTVLDLRSKRPLNCRPAELEEGRILNLSGRKIKPLVQQEVLLSQENYSVRGILPSKEQLLTELEEIEGAEKTLDCQLVSEPEKVSPEIIAGLEEFYFPEVASQKYQAPVLVSQSAPARFSGRFNFQSLFGFVLTGFLIALIIPMMAWLSQGLEIKDGVLTSSLSAYQSLLSARESLEQANWQSAEQSFSSAHSDFYQANQEINKLGRLTLSILEKLPGGNLVSSGSHLVKVGESLAQAGRGLSSAAQLFSYQSLFGLVNLASQTTLTDLMAASQDDLNQALIKIRLANQELSQVEVGALPKEIQEEVSSLKQKLPLAQEALVQAVQYSEALLQVLGHDNPRQYLLIFQNNSEVRATGGFIGTYGLLVLDKGIIKELFIDGIFNADGQLHEKIIPPQPIQKISTAWSMHDANWFADFPTSAQKIEWFYEKTGGPTIDGVISFTPTVVERLLELTGPIEMPDYEAVLTPDNFVELVQYEVETDYDKELNQPKKILADFAPLFIGKLSQLSSDKKQKALEIILDCLEEKHILIYFNNPALQEVMAEQGWTGQVLETDKDYLSVVSSNINGYKTDKMIKETISHQAEIQPDGSIIDTLTIIREHQGGAEKYDWWNRVNANYLRVYLPKGSQLISAKGQTPEIYQPPINYQEQGFKTDLLVSLIESRMATDKKTGTQIFEENNKTVFGNWVYVSPGERVVLTYRYKLPFKIDLTKPSDSYSLLAQKQSGSSGSQFSQKIVYPEQWQISWQYPVDLTRAAGEIKYLGNLINDRFIGLTFGF